MCELIQIIKGIPEDPDEDTSEKILELLEYLGYQVEADEVERANRVGEKSTDKTVPRAIVVELVSYKLKQSILREAAQKLRHTPYRWFITYLFYLTYVLK